MTLTTIHESKKVIDFWLNPVAFCLFYNPIYPALFPLYILLYYFYI